MNKEKQMRCFYMFLTFTHVYVLHLLHHEDPLWPVLSSIYVHAILTNMHILSEQRQVKDSI